MGACQSRHSIVCGGSIDCRGLKQIEGQIHSPTKVSRKGTDETSRSEEFLHADDVDAGDPPGDPPCDTTFSTPDSNKLTHFKPKLKWSSTASPSSATAPESEDEPSPCSALSSLYFASPLTTAILEEEEDPDMPSDEEDSVYETNQVPMDEVSGSLRKLKTVSSTFAPPVKLEEPSPPGRRESVSEDALAHFQQLKLHARIQNKSKKKSRKQAKLQERLEEDQANRQLWAAYQDLEQDVSSVSSREKLPLASQCQALNEMYFDFSSVDFSLDEGAGPGDENGSQCSQSNLSLLSEQSMEAQLRYYAEKKKKKKSRKKSASETTSKGSVGGSVSTFGSKDYGPPRRSAGKKPSARDEGPLFRNMEVMVPDLETSSQTHEIDNASCVSDLGDESTLGSNASSFNDYGVPRRRRRPHTVMPAAQPKSLKSKLDSLESAVAELRGSTTFTEAMATSVQKLEPVQLGEPRKMEQETAVHPLEQAPLAEEFNLQILRKAEESETITHDFPQSDNLQAVQETSCTTEEEFIPNKEKAEIISEDVLPQSDNLQAVQETSYATEEESILSTEESKTMTKNILLQSDSFQAVQEISYSTEDESIPNILDAYDSTPKRGGSKEPLINDDSDAIQLPNMLTKPPKLEVVPLHDAQLANDSGCSIPLMEVEQSYKADSLDHTSDPTIAQARAHADAMAQRYSHKSIHSLTTEEFRLLSYVFDEPPSDEDSLSPSEQIPLAETTEQPRSETASPAICEGESTQTSPRGVEDDEQ